MAAKSRISGTQKFIMLKASSSGCCVPHNFALLLALGGTHVHPPHHIPHCAPNEIDYGKINVEANSRTAVSTKITSLTWRH